MLGTIIVGGVSGLLAAMLLEVGLYFGRRGI